MDRAIAEIGGAGYQGVELFDGNVLDYPGGAKALASALSGAGVKLVAAYSGANFIFLDSSIRNSAASPASLTPPLSSRRSIW